MPATIEQELAKTPQLTQHTWLDLHTHLNMLEQSPEIAIAEAQALGIKRLVTIGTEPNDLPVVLGLAQKFYPVVTCTLGIHPHEGGVYSQAVEDFILKEAPAKEVVAIGEIGLDYYYKHSSPEDQKKAFIRQMEIAEQLKMPVEIHTRDADDDTIDILKMFKGRVRGILHCFTGTQKLATEALNLDYNISISGVVTFKNADSLRDIVKNTPLDRLHVETDAPFLTPAPFRGVKNTPQYVIFTARFVAELKNTPLDQFAPQMLENAQKMFPKLPLANL